MDQSNISFQFNLYYLHNITDHQSNVQFRLNLTFMHTDLTVLDNRLKCKAKASKQ